MATITIASPARENMIFRLLSGLTFLIPMLFASISANAVQNVTVRTEGLGLNIEEAIDNGLRNAITQVYGALTLTERVVRDDDLEESNISYSKGVVESYKVIQYHQRPSDKLFVTEMHVTVSPAAIGKKIAYSSDTKAISGEVLGQSIIDSQRRINSEAQLVRSSNNLLNHLLLELPASLYDVHIDEVKVEKDGTNVAVKVIVSIKPNKQILDGIISVAEENESNLKAAHGSRYQEVANSMGLIHILSGTRHSDMPPAPGSFIFFHVDAQAYSETKSRFLNQGICLTFLGNGKDVITKVPFKSRLFAEIPLNSRREVQSSPSHPDGVLIGQGNAREAGISIRRDRKAFKQEIVMPGTLDKIHPKLSSIQAKMITDLKSCKN